MAAHLWIWLIVAFSVAGVILRPFGLAEAIPAIVGALLLVALQFLAPSDALVGVIKGADVYLFLIGMMVLAEIARQEGLFDWLAAHATRAAKGSARRLFLLIYVVGVVVTTFMSNDATAVVLTPAVAASMRTARVTNALPYLLICAFIANAASFVLPISNPANLVIYGSRMPALGAWLPIYALPSLAAIIATYTALRWTQRLALREDIARDVPVPLLSRSGQLAALGIALTALVLLAASALDLQLGAPTAAAGTLTAITVFATERKSPWGVLKAISWDVLVLVAGLFILVEALDKSGLVAGLAGLLVTLRDQSATVAACVAGSVVALASNVANNLPVGLIAGDTLHAAGSSDQVTAAVLIGVDLGPNLSVTGSLATILWLNALRREGFVVSAWTFLKLGAVVMPPAFVFAIAAIMVH